MFAKLGTHPENFLQILMVWDKTMHKAFRTHKTLQTKQFFFFFTFPIYQNYTLVLKPMFL